jgi:hypothetical protein
MKKADRTQKGKKPSDQGPEKSKAVIELTEQDLEQVQGGLAANFRVEIGGLPCSR